MRHLVFLATMALFTVPSWAAQDKWQTTTDTNHPYWAKQSCWAFIDGKAGESETSLQVYSDSENELGRPLILLLTPASEMAYEATLYFNDDPNGNSYELIRVAKAGTQQQLAFSLPKLTDDKTAEALFDMIKLSTAHVEIRNEAGVVRTVDFSLSKSSRSIRFVIDNCFTHLSTKFKRL